MVKKNASHFALTMRCEGLARSIVSKDAWVSEAYNPDEPPSLIPKWRQVSALWDTGATNTTISKSLASELQLPVIGKQLIAHANGTDECTAHVINVYLPNNVRVVGVSVAASNLAGIDILIGMDIITLGDFALTNKDGNSCFSFKLPSSDCIDYVEQLNRLNAQGLGRNDPCWCKSGKKYKDCHGSNNSRN